MRFVCDSCRAQYMISDDKIGAKGVKIRCKKCGHVIVVRPTGAAAPKDEGSSSASAPEAAAAASSNGANGSGAAGVASLGNPPEGGLFTGVEEDEIGAVFDQVLNSGSQKIPGGEPASEPARESKPSTPEAVRKLAAAEEEQEEPKAAPPANDWYVAIDEKQVGPLTVDKIKEHWDRGEVGPDSLCWRAGFSDWIPLSDATELASVLAPRPAKPVIVAPAAVAAPVASTPEPVESAFSAGASAKSNRPEIPAAPALGKEPTSSGWKPSAASVLASLVKEENDALAKPPAKPAAEEKPAAPGLLDLPPPEPALAPAARAAPMLATAMAEPMRAPQPAAMPYAPAAPAYAQPAPAYAQPAYAPAGYPQPAYSGYPPGAVPGAQGGNNKMIMVAAIAAGAVVLAVVGGIFVFRAPPAQPPPEQVAVVTPPSQQGTRTPDTAPPAQPEVKAQPPAPNPAVANPSAQPPPGAAATPAPAPVPAAGVAAGGTPAATPPSPPAATPAPPTPSEAVAKASPGTRESGSGTRRNAESPRSNSGSRPEPAIAKPSSSGSGKSSDEGEGDDFDDLFGTGKKSSTKPGSGEKTPSTYIPPEPGGGSNVPERLGQSDIMSVVVANKPAIVKCVSEQKKQQPGLTGKLVMRWTIQTSGRTTGVAVKSEEFKKTYMANCISGLIKSWTFPKHKKQGEPIDFPFTF